MYFQVYLNRCPISGTLFKQQARTHLDQIDKFIGWLERRDRTRLAQVVVVLRKCFGDEVKLEARMYEALTDLQTYVAKVRSGPIRKLLKTPVAALCRSRDVQRFDLRAADETLH